MHNHDNLDQRAGMKEISPSVSWSRQTQSSSKCFCFIGRTYVAFGRIIYQLRHLMWILQIYHKIHPSVILSHLLSTLYYWNHSIALTKSIWWIITKKRQRKHPRFNSTASFLHCPSSSMSLSSVSVCLLCFFILFLYQTFLNNFFSEVILRFLQKGCQATQYWCHEVTGVWTRLNQSESNTKLYI